LLINKNFDYTKKKKKDGDGAIWGGCLNNRRNEAFLSFTNLE